MVLLFLSHVITPSVTLHTIFAVSPTLTEEAVGPVTISTHLLEQTWEEVDLEMDLDRIEKQSD